MQETTDTAPRLTSAELALLPEDDRRYELIAGKLYVSRQPHWHHQLACTRLGSALDQWSTRTGLGVANSAPGLIFAEDDDVAPDLVWISMERLAHALRDDGKLHAAPELVIEVLSPGVSNEQRDRQAKLKLYARRGVQEYWIVDWQQRQGEIYRRTAATLQQVALLYHQDTLESPLLPGFRCPMQTLFMDVPRQA